MTGYSAMRFRADFSCSAKAFSDNWELPQIASNTKATKIAAPIHFRFIETGHHSLENIRNVVDERVIRLRFIIGITRTRPSLRRRTRDTSLFRFSFALNTSGRVRESLQSSYWDLLSAAS